MKSGIYHIVCRKTGRVYVGQSIDLGQRWNQHLAALTDGTHVNKPMQADFISNGHGGFYFVVREYCHADLLDYAEAREMDTLSAMGVELFNTIVPDPQAKGGVFALQPWAIESLYHLCRKNGASPTMNLHAALQEKLERDIPYIENFRCIKTKLPEGIAFNPDHNES